MSPITAADVAELRARTGVSMLACKEALEEAKGDQEKAIEILRKRGIAQAVKKADRTQNEGALFVAQGQGKAALVSLKCETDFVARNADFLSFGQGIAETLLEKDLDAAKADAEKRMPEFVQKLGENITLGEMQEITAPAIGSYVHSNRKIAVVIGLDLSGAESRAKDVAMHAAAMNPAYVYPDDVPQETLEKEREIWKEQLKNEKKPENILDKIMLGKEKKFREENALIKQPFVKDQNMTVEKYLDGARVESYVRVVI
ncbi:MAG: translation elongation factor Ts [Candidatus Peribacteraceae bacterium]|jgi:elongation factor Ts